MANNPSRLYKDVWIGLGGTQSAVYATEVSAEEYLAYTTEETEKVYNDIIPVLAASWSHNGKSFSLSYRLRKNNPDYSLLTNSCLLYTSRCV